jgi:two-component system, OmpR family, sensor histidine kinase QseC
MTPSIRTFLLINLFLSVTLITSLAIIGNLVLSHKDIQKQLDTQLVHTAVSIQALLSLELKENDLNTIQNSLDTNRKKTLKSLNLSESLASLPKNVPTSAHNFFIEFQVWNDQKQLVLRSPGAPFQAFTDGIPGLSNVNINDQAWRVYTLVDENTHYTLMIAEHVNYRQALENRLTQDSIYIMLLSYPFLALLIWFIVGKALHILKKVTQEVSHRAPSYLESFDLSGVPAEIVPLVEALNHLFGRLRDAFEREKRFTGDAAHELKTPLAAISAQAQAGLRANHADNRETLTKILEGVNRSNHIIQQLLTLSRMVPEASTQDMCNVRLSREVADTAAMLAPDAIQKNIELEFLSPDSTATVSGNVTAIGILIRNLIDNAIRYTPRNGWVNIDIKESPTDVTLIVTDSGPGIPPELRGRVFERFYRIVGNKSPGSGLGLGIVQQIAKLHGAEVLLLTPESGTGLEVQVKFPK